jgi:hypothetical protein
MGYYYPQAAVTMNILWEDGKVKSDAAAQKPYPLRVLAKSVTVTINDYSTADTFECEIDYQNFPFDPRAIRAVGVTIHMSDVGELFRSTNELHQLNLDTANTVFVGFADDSSISFDDTKRTVKLEGRDYTALFIDRPYLEGTIALTNRLDVLLQKILDDLQENANKKIELDLRGINAESLPVLSTFDQSHQLSGKKTVDRHENYWEVIQDLAARSGLIAFIELDQLVLTQPRSLYSATGAKVFVYGRNIKNLTYKRKIGRKKNFNVIVRSVVEKEVLEAKVPAEATAEWSKTTGIAIGEVKLPEIGPNGEPVDKAKWRAAPYMSFRVPNCKDKSHLITIAEGIYEEVSRQQIEGSFETKEMTTSLLKSGGTDKNGKAILVDSYRNDPNAFNILKLRNGTPIQITVDQGDLKGIASESDVNKRTQYLLRRGYPQAVANIFAKTLSQFINVYYTKQVRFSIDNESGFKAQIDFLNFIDTKAKGTV